jgi:hypothetical protein
MQSRRQSLIEAITNVAVGYALAVLTQIVVFPWFGLKVSLNDNLAIGAMFVMFASAQLCAAPAVRALAMTGGIRPRPICKQCRARGVSQK